MREYNDGECSGVRVMAGAVALRLSRRGWQEGGCFHCIIFLASWGSSLSLYFKARLYSATSGARNMPTKDP